jgi:hypothetical protein
MHLLHPRTKGIVPLAILASLLLTDSNRGSAQEPVQAPAAAPSPSTGPALVAPADDLVVDTAAPSPECKTAEPSSIFAKVPPIPQIIARPGVFFLAPQGPGYYSLWDFITNHYREKRPPQPYSAISFDPYPFFDADFSYLDKPDAELQSPFDVLHRMHIGDNFMLSFGGEERLRIVNEVNSRLTGKDNNYQLLRTRAYGDLWYQDRFRVYVEFIDAETYNQNLAPLPIDVNKSDLLNAFVDIKIMDLCDTPVYFRGGRQELAYGSQRLISPLDWANTLRTFEGAKVFRYAENFEASAFWVQPVIINPVRFDSVDDKQNFTGVWFTYRPVKGQAIDLYFLNLDNGNHNVTGQNAVPGSFNTSTIGSRYAGNYKNLLFDFEGMYQFGSWSNQNTSAAAYTTALGWNFADVPMTPQFWVSWDYASGDHNPGTTGTHGTFNQLFPFGHYYFGFIDDVGRMNIEDFNMQLVVWPTKWITSWAQFHVFRLDSAKDALYGASGVVLRRDPTGKSGTDVGDELDLVTNFHLAQNQDICIGFSKLFEGAFLRNTGPGPSPELFYVQYSFRW